MPTVRMGMRELHRLLGPFGVPGPRSEKMITMDDRIDLRHHGDAELAPGLVDLAVNVRPAAMPAWLAEPLAASLHRLAAYPDQTRAIRAAAERHGRHGDEVLLTAGAAEAFVLVARGLRPRRAVV